MKGRLWLLLLQRCALSAASLYKVMVWVIFASVNRITPLLFNSIIQKRPFPVWTNKALVGVSVPQLIWHFISQLKELARNEGVQAFCPNTSSVSSDEHLSLMLSADCNQPQCGRHEQLVIRMRSGAAHGLSDETFRQSGKWCEFRKISSAFSRYQYFSWQMLEIFWQKLHFNQETVEVLIRTGCWKNCHECLK